MSSSAPLANENENDDIDWILNAVVSPLAVVDRHLRFVAVNDAYCAAGGRTRAELLGAVLFDVFPADPDDAQDTGPADLRESLLRVLSRGMSESIPLQRYDVQDGVAGPFVQRCWSITTSPVRRRADGPIELAVVHAEEVTSYVDERLRREAAGQQPRTAGHTDAVDTVFTAALQHSATLNDFAVALVTVAGLFPTDRDPVAFGRDRPLPTAFAPVNRVRAGPFTTKGCFVL